MPHQAKVLSLLYYLIHSWREDIWIYAFPLGISAIWKCKQPCPGFELELKYPFPLAISITPQVPPHDVFKCADQLTLVCLSVRVYKRMLLMSLSLCLQQCLARLTCMESGLKAVVLWNATSKICSKLHVAFLCSSHLAFFHAFYKHPCGASKQ